jgi:NADH dehydrogenase
MPQAAGHRYDLCGPKAYALRELVEYVCEVSGRRPIIIGLGDAMSSLQAWLMEFSPVPLMTRDNVRSMQIPNACPEGSDALPFGLVPTPLEAAAPSWLAPVRPRDRYLKMRWRARR